jgi:2-C-methyl-D-erythritol 2,4-cyclodiphosphate synthase
MLRIGHGYDVHRFGDGDVIMLGGVSIPHSQGLEAHSDGDVLLHALCDALLGAIGLGDIGRHFPDSDPQYAGADSRVFLQEVYRQVTAAGYELQNADITVVAQAPRLATHIETIRENIAGVLRLEAGRINVKATTTEGLGFAGREEGIAVHAVVLIAAGAEP